jgi:hypothetical protein
MLGGLGGRSLGSNMLGIIRANKMRFDLAMKSHVSSTIFKEKCVLARRDYWFYSWIS